MTPSAAPSGAQRATAVSQNPNFKGILQVDPVTGNLKVTNASPAGVYPIVIRAYNGTSSMQAMHTLTVTDPNCSQGLLIGTNDLSAVAPSSVKLGDFNGDEIPDLAFLDASGLKVNLGGHYWHNGFEGHLHSVHSTTITVAAAINAFEVGDFNGDGNMDLIASQNFDILLLLGNGAGGFTSTMPTLGAINTEASDLKAADFNGDGYLDVARANNLAPEVSIFLGNGQGGFTLGSTVNIGNQSADHLATGDFNGDSKVDLVIGAAGLMICLGDGTGNMTITGTYPIQNLNKAEACDINEDGMQDLLYTFYQGNGVFGMLGNGNGGFAGSIQLTSGANGSFAVGDFNGDGHQDLATPVPDSVQVRLGSGSGTFSGGSSVGMGGNTWEIVAADFERDGKLDFACTVPSIDKIVCKTNADPEIVVGEVPYPVYFDSGAPADGDMDPDHKADFGLEKVGDSVHHSFTIKNLGSMDLTIPANGITFTGVDASMWTVSGITQPVTIPMGQYHSFTLHFAPTSLGVKNAVVHISNNDCDEGSYDFAVRGTGAECAISTCIGQPLNFTPTSSGQDYSWDFGDLSYSGDAAPSHAFAAEGTYEVRLTVTDAHGCATSSTQLVCVYAAPTATHTELQPACHGSTGSINVTVAGGAPNTTFTYAWSPGGATTEDLSGLGAGSYSVTITDATTLCTVTMSNIVITEPSELIVTIDPVADICAGTSTATINANVSGGTPGYQYLWTPGNSHAPTLTNVGAGTYNVTVTDANGCQATTPNGVVVGTYPVTPGTFNITR